MYSRKLTCLSALAALAIPALAQAQDFTPTADRILSDPTYLPLKGEIFGQSGYSYGWGGGSATNAAGALASTTNSSVNTFSQSLAYGLTDALSVNLGLNYQTDRDHAYSANGAYSAGPRGFDDPTFGLTWRALDQKSHPASLDFFASYAPDVFPLRVPSPYGGGTVASGGDAVDFGARLGRETKMFTIQGVVSATHYGDSDAFNQTTGATRTTSGYWAPTLALNTQTRLTDRFSVNVGAGYTFVDNANVANTLTNVSYQALQGNHGDVDVGLNYHFIPNRLVGSLDYRHTFYDHTDNVFAADPSLNSQIEHTGNLVGGTVRYVFR